MQVGSIFLGRLVAGITDTHLMLVSNVEKYPHTDTYKSVWIKYKLK